MSSFGVTPTGFQQKTLEDILAEVQDEQRAAFGAGLNLLATSIFGQQNGILANRFAELWEALVAVYRSQYPDSASGEALDNVASLTGVLRLAASKSFAEDVILTGSAGTVVPVGRVISVVGAGDRFVSLSGVTLAGAIFRAPLTAYTVGTIRRGNGGNIYVVTVAGTTAAGFGPTGTGMDIVDGTVHWRFVGGGTAVALVDFEAEQTGPVNAPAFTLTVIETPVSGWQGVGNQLDADLGRDEETDPDLRLRRQKLLRATGSATVDAIRGRVLEVPGVQQAFVFENVTLATDADGLPPKSFEVVVEGGADQDIADTIFLHKPAGIETFGTTTATVLDSQGFSHQVKLSRPTALNMFVDVTVRVDLAAWPVDGPDRVKLALVALGDALQIGEDITILKFRCQPLETVPGVLDVPVMEIDTVSDPVNTSNFVVGIRQLAVFDTSRINVTVVT